jgi:MarR family transcriptional regulator, lower aerobic nicotinate degradation pathway regulator
VHNRESGRPLSRLKDRPTWLIGRAFVRSSGLLNASFEAHGNGLRGYHYRLLAALEEWGPVSQADLGRSTGIDRSDVTAAVGELESRNLIRRTVDPENKRRKIVTLTPEGARQLRDLDTLVDAIQDELLAPLSGAQRSQFITLMHGLLGDSG